MNPVSARLPGQGDQPVEPDPLLDLGALGPRALVVPEDRGPDHAIRRVEGDEAVHLAREPDPGDPRPRPACVREAREHRPVARHQSSGSCSDQPARGVESG